MSKNNKINKLKEQYRKLGDEIDKLESTSSKWYKVFTAKWSESDGSTTAYSMMYLSEEGLSKLKDYTIINTWDSQQHMMDSLFPPKKII